MVVSLSSSLRVPPSTDTAAFAVFVSVTVAPSELITTLAMLTGRTTVALTLRCPGLVVAVAVGPVAPATESSADKMETIRVGRPPVRVPQL